MKRYSEMIRYDSFEDRFEYLRLDGRVGKDTFGFDRFLNQTFYRSKEWKDIRNHVITRDNGCDLGDIDRPIYDRVLVHHMNPIVPEDLETFNPAILDPEYLITISIDTHNAVHYGNKNNLTIMPPDRSPGDTRLW